MTFWKCSFGVVDGDTSLEFKPFFIEIVVGVGGMYVMGTNYSCVTGFSQAMALLFFHVNVF